MNAETPRRALGALVGVGLVWSSSCATAQVPVPTSAQSNAAQSDAAQSDDIVVTAQRSGIPVWRVVGPRGTVVLVGAVGNVPAGTKWDPVSLDAALAKADRVIFPEAASLSNIGLFSAVGALAKWRKQASLPEGQTLQAMTTPEQWARLVALQRKGVLKPGFERKHPYHLAISMVRSGRPKAKFVPGAEAYVRRFVKKNKAKRVPLAKVDFKVLLAEYFRVAPQAHVACMMDAVTVAEAGAPRVQANQRLVAARAAAWAARRVPEALAAKTDYGMQGCWPNGTRMMAAYEASLTPAIRGVLDKPQVTLAVVSLDSLGERGGVLDDLVKAGFDVRGPRWR